MSLTCRHTIPFELCIIANDHCSIFFNIGICLIKYHDFTTLVINESIWALRIKREKMHENIRRKLRVNLISESIEKKDILEEKLAKKSQNQKIEKYLIDLFMRVIILENIRSLNNV